MEQLANWMTDVVVSQPAVHAYAIVAAVLVLKMLLTANLTGITRMVKGVFITSEDYRLVGKEPAGEDGFIERTRRIQRNDLENILPFLIIAPIFALLSGVSATTAYWLFGIFTVARILHTLAYLAALQPWRTLVFTAGDIVLYIITIWTLIAVI